MSRIYKLFRKTDGEKIETELAPDKESRENMDISEIKRKILEKIEREKAGSSGKEKAALSILSEKLGVATAESHATAVTVSAETPPPAASREIERTAKESVEDIALAESENEELKKLQEDALKRNEDLILQLKEKTATISELERRLTEEFEDIKKEKEKTVGSVDTLISRVYSTDREAKARASRINQLEDALKAKEKRLAEIDRLCKQLENINNENESKIMSYEQETQELRERASRLTEEAEAGSGRLSELDSAYKAAEIAKDEAELKLESLAREVRELEGKVSQLTDELDAGSKRVIEMEKLNREIDDIAKEASFRLHAIEREKKNLEEKAASLSIELETTGKRHDSEKAVAQEKMNKLRSELDMAKHIIKEKEKDEMSLREALSQAVSGQDLRDKKIEADMRYYEKLIKEINELKQQVRILGSKRNNPGI